MRLVTFFKVYILNAAGFVKKVCSKKTLNNIIEQIYNTNHSDSVKAFSTALGVFIGIIPIWGFQTVIAIFLAVVFRLNKALVVIFSQVSFPPLIPLVIFLSYRAGNLFINGLNAGHLQHSFQNFNSRLQQYIYGSISLAFSAAIIIGLLTFSLLKLIKALKRIKLPAVLPNPSISISN